LKIIIFKIPVFIFVLILSGCDGIFPTAPKSTVPSDHTSNLNGFLHKGGERDEMNPDECDDCHSLDLKGKVSNINGVPTWAPSCLQCHGEVWKRNGENMKVKF
jgi:hypothetical protein